MTGIIANRFELQNLLGRGGMGEVYRAMETQTGETVAVKALDSEAGGGLLESMPCDTPVEINRR